MPELHTKDRIKFSKKGGQRGFILKCKKALVLTSLSLAKKLNVSQRTVTDWISEKFYMPYASAMTLSKLSKILIAEKYQIIDWKKRLQKIGKKGGKKRLEIYGKVTLNESYRARRWKEWWQSVGKYKSNSAGFQSILEIKLPTKDIRLAEFMGIMLGDGGVAPYHIHITLSNTEKKYANYIIDLVNELFGVVPKVHKLKYAQAIDIVIHRKQLVTFCQEIGLVRGNKIKQQIDIPEWIKSNTEFSKACVRGLIDTDGCFYDNSYTSNNKKYSYFKIAFTSASLPLRLSVAKILNDLNIKTSIDHKDVRINDIQSVQRYIEIIGSHNQKHLDKILRFTKNRP